MGKTAIDAARGTIFRMDPDRVILVTDKKHHLYDSRAEQDADPFLVASILSYGVAQPIGITKEKGEGDQERVILVYGRRRLLAARQAKQELIQAAKRAGTDPDLTPILIPCTLHRGSSEHLAGLMITENAARQDLSLVEEADRVVKHLALCGNEETTATAFACDVQTVRSRVKLAELDKQVRLAILAGKISVSAALQLHGLPIQEQRDKLKGLLASAGTYQDGTEKPVTIKQTKKSKGATTAPSKGTVRKAYEAISSFLDAKDGELDKKVEKEFHKSIHDTFGRKTYSDDYLQGLEDALKWSRGF